MSVRRRPTRPPERLRVLKFGGATLDRLPLIAARLSSERRAGRSPVVVVSARAGVTDRLERWLRHRRPSAAALLGELRERHLPGSPPLERQLRALEGQLARAAGSNEPILAAGERLAVEWLSAELQRTGLPTVPLHADRLGLQVGEDAEGPTVDIAASRSAVGRSLKAHLRAGRLPLVTGFFGRDRRGRVRTLGRGGSDLTAVALAALLRLPSVELVKHDAPVRSADPGLVPTTVPLRRLRSRDAVTLAHFGTRMLHEPAVRLAEQAGIRIVISPLNGSGTTTVIRRRGPPVGPGALAFRPGLRLIGLRAASAGGQEGPSGEWLAQLSKVRIPFELVGEHGPEVAFVVREELAATAERELRGVFGSEGGPGAAAPISLIALVGADGGRMTEFPDDVVGWWRRRDATVLAVRPESAIPVLRRLHERLIERRVPAPMLPVR